MPLRRSKHQRSSQSSIGPASLGRTKKPRKSKAATTAIASTSAQSQQPQNTESSSPTQPLDGNPTGGPTSYDYLTRQDIPGIVQQFADVFWNEFQRSSDSTVTGETTPVVRTGCTTSQPPSVTSTPPVTVQITSHRAPLPPRMVGYSIS